jgi:hypothetical protein
MPALSMVPGILHRGKMFWVFTVRDFLRRFQPQRG